MQPVYAFFLLLGLILVCITACSSSVYARFFYYMLKWYLYGETKYGTKVTISTYTCTPCKIDNRIGTI